VARSQWKALENQLLAELGQHVVRLGFDAKPIGQSFYRSMPGGYSAFHVSFIAHAEDFDVTADVAVRFDAVEELVNRDNGLISPAEKKRTATLGAELGNIASATQRRWKIQSSDDIHPAALEIVDALERVGIPYLEQFEDPGRAFIALSSNASAAWLNSPIHGCRCLRAVALAVVLNRQAEYAQVATDCEEFLRQRKDPALIAFQRFLKALASPL